MARRWRIRIVIAVVAVPLLVFGYDNFLTIYWVGSTDLEVEFVVTDASTHNAIPGAHVEIQSAGGFYTEDYDQEFVLIADANGSARKVCKQSMCFGTQSGLRFTDTFVVHLPWWRYRVVVEGYKPSEWANLDVVELCRQVQRAGRGKSKLIVQLSLKKR